jgi:hypothetical protein
MFMICSPLCPFFTMSLVHNERTKLTATWFNALATAFIAAGLFAPLAALLYGLADLRIGPLYVAALIVACVGGGVLLHWSGLLVLGRLRE